MKYFKLPDLGEGLQEAEIIEWLVKPGDQVKSDQIVVTVETAKAIVEIPSPQDGIIGALFGTEGDIIHIGEPLIEFAGEEQEDTGTVVGEMKQATDEPQVDQFTIGSTNQAPGTHRSYTTPAIRSLAKRLGVDIDQLSGTGKFGLITAADVEKSARLQQDLGRLQPLRGVRRAMANNLAKAHREVVQVTINDDADIHAWKADTDPTMRLVRAIGKACREEPNLNAWYDGAAIALRVIEKVDLGIAVDTKDGLFVPVLRDIAPRTHDNLREGLNKLRADIKARTIPPAEMINPTITLSNFGTIFGRYGNPVVVPPTVAIIGAGVIRDEVVADQGNMAVHSILPLSLSFDHRAVTGGEAARFFAALVEDISLAE